MGSVQNVKYKAFTDIDNVNIGRNTAQLAVTFMLEYGLLGLEIKLRRGTEKVRKREKEEDGEREREFAICYDYEELSWEWTR